MKCFLWHKWRRLHGEMITRPIVGRKESITLFHILEGCKYCSKERGYLKHSDGTIEWIDADFIKAMFKHYKDSNEK